MRKKKNNDGKIVVILIIALIAFAIGSAVGINISLNGLDTVDNNTTHEVNVTNNMMQSASSSSSSSASANNVSAQDVYSEYQSQINEYT